MWRYVVPAVAQIRARVVTRFRTQEGRLLRKNTNNIVHIPCFHLTIDDEWKRKEILTLKLGLGGEMGSVCLYGEIDLEGQEGSSPTEKYTFY